MSNTDDVRLTAQLVAGRKVHCVSDASVEALARRVLELEANHTQAAAAAEATRRAQAEAELADVRAAMKTENVSLSMRLAHVENLACAAAFDVGLAQARDDLLVQQAEDWADRAVHDEREACTKFADLHESLWRAFEADARLEPDRWQHRQQANVARDIANAIRARWQVSETTSQEASE